MKSASKPSLRGSALSRIGMLLSAALIAVSQTGCSSLSDAIKEAQLKAASAKVSESKPVVVAAAPAPAKLPDIPSDVEKCLTAKPKAEGATADAKVTALVLADRTKARCAATLFKWYRERQAAAADGHPKTEKKGKPVATWE